MTINRFCISIYLIGALLIVFLGLISCSDNPYTGSMMQPGDLDKYLSYPGGGRVCLLNGSDSVCVTLYPKRGDQLLPVIHIHPSSTTYLFYYKGEVIMQAERASDNTDLIDDKQPESDRPPRDVGGQQPPGTVGGGGGGQTPPNNNVGTDDGTDNGGTDKDAPNNNDGNIGDPNNGGNTDPNNGGNNGDPNNGGNNGGTNNGGNNDGNNNGGTNNGGNIGGTNNGGNNDGNNNGGTNNGGNIGDPNNGDNGNNNGNNGDNGNKRNDGNNGNNGDKKNDGNNGNNGDERNDGNNGNNNNNNEDNGNKRNDGNNNGNNGNNNNGDNGDKKNDGNNGNNGDKRNDGNNGNNNNDGNNNGNNGNNNNGNNNGGGVASRNNPNPSGHNPPDNVLSHLVYGHADDDPAHPTHVDGWIVWIFYPHNYVEQGHPRGLGMGPINSQTGPRSVDDPVTTDYREDYGFTFRVTGGEVRNFSQTSGECTDELIGSPPAGDSVDNRQTGKDNRDDWDDTPCSASGSDYSTQMFVKSSATKITISIKWTHGMYAGQTQTFNIMKEISMKEYDEEGYDPGHLNQHRWD